MKINYVLDTNVVLHDPRAIYKFEDNNVHIPIYVLEELEKFKGESSERGRNAREFSRQLDGLREFGSLSDEEGVPLFEDREGSLFVHILDDEDLPVGIREHIMMDTYIMMCAEEIRIKSLPIETVLVTKDVALRVRADADGIPVEDYQATKVLASEHYEGHTEIYLSKEEVSKFFKQHYLKIDNEELSPNEFLVIRTHEDPKNTVLGKYDAKGKQILPLNPALKKGVFGIKPKNLQQRFALDALMDPEIKLVTLLGRAGSGKAQPLDAKVLTPTGWELMGNLQIGDRVIGSDGSPVEVVGVFPQGKREIYRVHFSDNTSTRCCKDHLWYTRTNYDRDHKQLGTVKSLAQIMESLRTTTGKRVHSVPVVKPVQYDPVDLPMDPYLLGALLGDGTLVPSGPIFSSVDQEIIDLVETQVSKLGCELRQIDEVSYRIKSSVQHTTNIYATCVETGDTELYKSIRELEAAGYNHPTMYKAAKSGDAYLGYTWQVTPVNSSNQLKSILLDLGIWGKLSYQKSIPALYMRASIKDRLELLRGLMDTDGTVSKDRATSAYFCSTSKELALQVQELVWSLGGKSSIRDRITSYTYKGVKKSGRVSYRVGVFFYTPSMNPFNLSRKSNRWEPTLSRNIRKYIDRVELIGEHEAQCIMVDSDSHLYVTDDFIVTHNTILACAAGLKQVMHESLYEKVMVARPVMPMGKEIGFLPGSISEKLDPYMQPIYDNIRVILGSRTQDGKEIQEELKDKGILSVEPLTFIRGRSIPGQFIILDEAQNLSMGEVKTIITRVGEGTKIVLTGDPDQIDSPHLDSQSNGLSYVIKKFKDQSIAASITLTKGERSELATLAAEIL